jgi:hypothetical protein
MRRRAGGRRRGGRVRRAAWIAVFGLLLVAAGFVYQRFWRAPSTEELDELRQQRRQLEGRLGDTLAPEMSEVAARQASVVLAIPSRFAERLVQEIAPALLSDMTLTFRNIEVRKTGDIEARILIGRQRLGRFTVVVRLAEVRASLRAAKPQLQFASERVGVQLPVALTSGTARGTLRFEWDGRGVAGGVCGDLQIEGEIAGRLVPAPYTLRGRLELATDGTALVARPELEDLELKIGVEPSAETWQLVEKALQGRGALCRAVLNTADVPEKIRDVVGRGFVVALPRRLIRELRFPVALEQSVAVEGAPVHLQVRPIGVTLTPRRLWYGADVRLVEAKMEQLPR